MRAMDDTDSVSAAVPMRADNYGPNLLYRDLREWLDKKLITQEEYAAKTKQILSGIKRQPLR